MKSLLYRADNRPTGDRLDNNESAYFARQLEVIEPQIYRVPYPALMARTLFPTQSLGGGIGSITYRQMDRVGKAQIIGQRAKDLPRVDVTAAEFTQRVRHVGAAYGYDYFEIKEAARAGLALEAERGFAARQVIEQLIDEIAWFGDTNWGLPGVFSTGTGIPRTSMSAFSGLTADQIITALNSLVNTVVSSTKGIEIPDTLVLPIAQYAYIASTPRSATSDTTILEFFMANNPFIKNVGQSYRLTGAGTSGVDAVLCYRRAPDVLKLQIPVDFTQLPVQIDGFDYEIPCTADIAGVFVYKPKAMAIGEGI